MAYYSRHTGEEIDSLLEQISEGVIVEVDSSLSSTSKNPVQNKVVTSALANKQEKLISGTTIKTINSIPILGAGNIVISGGGSNSGVSYEEVEQMLQGKQDSISDLADIREGASLGATAIQREDLASVATSGSYNDLKNKPTIPVAVTESTVSGWGFTKNTGTYTKPSGGIPKDDMASGVQASLNRADTALQSYTEIYRGTITGVKMNGVVKGTSGQVDLGTVITEHQDISGKQDVIADLDSIRKKANSAIQSIPDEYVTSDELESTISSKGFATESWVEGKGYLTEHQDISKKQDVILDLAAIRAGAAKGATALQEVPDTYVTDDELASSLGGKQDTLVSGVNLKTINGTSLLGGGNVVIAGEGGISYDDTELRYLISNKVDKVEGKELSTNDFTDEDKAKLDSLENYDDTSVISLIRNKQDKLVSGSNIRTINGTSILGGGDIEIETGLGSEVVSSTSPTADFPQVLYTKQLLSESQKAQARANIGVTEDGGTINSGAKIKVVGISEKTNAMGEPLSSKIIIVLQSSIPLNGKSIGFARFMTNKRTAHATKTSSDAQRERIKSEKIRKWIVVPSIGTSPDWWKAAYPWGSEKILTLRIVQRPYSNSAGDNYYYYNLAVSENDDSPLTVDDLIGFSNVDGSRGYFTSTGGNDRVDWFWGKSGKRIRQRGDIRSFFAGFIIDDTIVPFKMVANLDYDGNLRTRIAL